MKTQNESKVGVVEIVSTLFQIDWRTTDGATYTAHVWAENQEEALAKVSQQHVCVIDGKPLVRPARTDCAENKRLRQQMERCNTAANAQIAELRELLEHALFALQDLQQMPALRVKISSALAHDASLASNF